MQIMNTLHGSITSLAIPIAAIAYSALASISGVVSSAGSARYGPASIFSDDPGAGQAIRNCGNMRS